MALFPLLKAAAWLAAEKHNNVLQQPLPGVRADLLGDAPRLTYAIVTDDTVSYVQRGVDGAVDADAGEQSFACLRSAIAKLEWQSLPGNTEYGFPLLVLEGDFHAAEALLLPERLQEAHALLDAEHLLAATPQRGQLVVAAYRPEQPQTLGAFAALCAELYDEPVNEPISPIVWRCRGGVIDDRLALKTSTSEPALRSPQKPPAASLFSVGQVVFITLFGGVWAGLYAFALNFRGLGLTSRYRLASVAAVLSIPLVLALYLQAPKTSIDRFFPLIAAVGMALLTQGSQGKLLKVAFNQGAKRRGLLWQLALIGGSLLIALVLVAVIVRFEWL